MGGFILLRCYGGQVSGERTTIISCSMFKDGYAIFTEGWKAWFHEKAE